MAGYTDVVARIATLDALLSGFDPSWQPTVVGAASGGLAGTGAQASGGTSAFAGVLADVSSGASPAADTIAATQSPYANTIYAGIRVMGGIVFSSPLPGGKLTQDFGPTSLAMEPAATVGGVHYAHYHPGIDLATRLGTPILAAASGTVIAAGRESDGAVIVKIRHADGYVTLYGHLSPDLEVKVGDQVGGGQEIGTEGLTGKTTGPHLHFALFSPSGAAVDPTQFLKSGRLPQSVSQTVMPGSLASPSSIAEPGNTTMAPASAVLARFDSVSSTIPYAAQIRSAAIANGIDPLLLAALASNESSFHATSVSSAGAKGLTQLMPGVASAMGVGDPFDPQQNLNGGAKYLALQLKRFGRIDKALAAYSKGPGTVWRAGTVPASAQAYVKKVLGKWSHYEESAS
jgi:murein DD-endopeptidase MepM/ murein hydrolase activator NlpD